MYSLNQNTLYYHSNRGGRQENEDSCGFTLYKSNLIAVVADGLGGHGDGKKASTLAVSSLLNCGASGIVPSPHQILFSFNQTNDLIRSNQLNSKHMKTTAVYFCLQHDIAIWAHIGDSRLYHFFNNNIVEYTLDHSVSQIAVSLGEITHEQIPQHIDRSKLLRALGCENITPEIHKLVRLEKGMHAFLLCTDGFWEYVPEKFMEFSLAKEKFAKPWINTMCNYLQAHCCPQNDNFTALAVCLQV